MSTATRTNPLSYLTDQLKELKAKGTHFKLRVLDDEQAPVCTFDGKRVINLASNNYLGLTTHPKLREAALEATRKYGVGSGAVRTIAGTMKIHMQLEEKIARFKNAEACVVFQSGFAANAGIHLRHYSSGNLDYGNPAHKDSGKKAGAIAYNSSAKGHQQ